MIEFLAILSLLIALVAAIVAAYTARQAFFHRKQISISLKTKALKEYDGVVTIRSEGPPEIIRIKIGVSKTFKEVKPKTLNQIVINADSQAKSADNESLMLVG